MTHVLRGGSIRTRLVAHWGQKREVWTQALESGHVTIFVEYGIGLLQYAHCDLVYVLVNPVLYIRMYMDSTARHLLAVKLVGG